MLLIEPPLVPISPLVPVTPLVVLVDVPMSVAPLADPEEGEVPISAAPLVPTSPLVEVLYDDWLLDELLVLLGSLLASEAA